MNAMSSKVMQALKTTIELNLSSHLKRCCWYEINVDDNRLELLVQETQDSLSQAYIIKLMVLEESKEIHIGNIHMLNFMRQQGIGKGLIAQIYGVAKKFKHSLFLVMMTQSFFDRMVKRGARVIDEGDCVQITDQTNLNPSA